MSYSLRAEEDLDRPGHARITVAGLAAVPTDPEFTLRREGYDRANLGPGGWQVGEARLRPVQAEVEDGAVVLIVGPAVTRHTEAGPLFFGLPAASLNAPVIWPDVDVFTGDLPSDPPPPAPPQAPRVVAPVPLPPVIETPPPAPAMHIEPSPPPPAGKSKVPLIAGAVVLLLAAGGAAWWFTASPSAVTPPVVIPPVSDLPPPPRSPWPDNTDGLALPELVQRAPDAAGIFAAALRRQATGRHDDALVLFEEAADRGHAPALTALARLYDPNGFVAGRPFRTPDPRAAARYYRDAARAADPAAAAPREALRQSLEGQARDNNSTAASALQEFWP